MNNFRKILSVTALFAVMACSAFAAIPITIESSRAHSAVGGFGCTVSGATVATPSVLTCSAAHNLVTGDQVQITGVGGTTTDNTTAYALVLSSTTFSIWADAATTATAIAGVGTYTSGGSVAKCQDISGATPTSAVSGDYTLRLRVNGMTAAQNAVVCIQYSTDGFVASLVTLACNAVAGPVGPAPSPYVENTWRSYDLPFLVMGTSNGKIRVNVQGITGGTVTTSLFLEQ
jgi:hypothetical protein